jgi:hypothetical protein
MGDCGCGQKLADNMEKRRSGPLARRKQPARPSCLECVEKHLGAAWVLIAEHQNGYPHRLLAIGHLHEAEEESQAWPELHDAIREVRKAYQRTGEVVDFDALAAIIAGQQHQAELGDLKRDGGKSGPGAQDEKE